MPAINNALSAFGISWPAWPSNDYQQQQHDMSTASFTQPVRTNQTNDAVSFGSYDNIESSHEEEGLEDALVNAAIGYEQGTSQPYTADRQRAMRILTRKGQILDGNPYRLPGVPHGAEQAIPRSKDDFEVVYHSDALAPIREEATTPPKLAVEAIQPRKIYQEARATAFLDDETLARLEGDELFPQEDDWDYVNDTEDAPVSKFSLWDSDSPPKRTGIFRSLSKKVKGSFRRPARPEISAPLLDLKHQPDNPAGMPTVMSYAVPLPKPASELAVRAGNVQEAIDMRRQNANIGECKPSKSKKRQDFEAPRTAPPRPQKQHKVKVVGDPDRMTQLGDFMDIQTLDSSSEELADDDDSYDLEREILKVRSLHPLRQPSKRVDTSKYSWMPPEPGNLSIPAQVTSQQDWHMSAECPTVDDLFDKTDRHIADMDTSDRRRSVDSHNRHRSQRSVDRRTRATSDSVANEDDEPEIMVDTYIQGDHTLWKATERVGENMAPSTQRQFRQTRDERSFEDDAAAALMKRLQALRK